ncbi:hypothetical protein J6590_053277 [Homalodisca vitripennis]|nr:hypothetical protein J6590_053277 [Homalodisca vitripennis]
MLRERDLSLEKMIKLCRATEMGREQAKELQGGGKTVAVDCHQGQIDTVDQVYRHQGQSSNWKTSRPSASFHNTIQNSKHIPKANQWYETLVLNDKEKVLFKLDSGAEATYPDNVEASITVHWIPGSILSRPARHFAAGIETCNSSDSSP